MKLAIHHLKFVLPDKPFGNLPKKLDNFSNELIKIAKKAGTGNDKFHRAYYEVFTTIKKGYSLTDILNKPIKVRALAVLLQSELKDEINLTQNVLNQVDKLRPNPSTLLIENTYQYYLSKYDHIDKPEVVASWLLKALEKKGIKKYYHKNILGKNGPKWIAEHCIKYSEDFNNVLTKFDLDKYSSGRFATVAKSIYFVKQLENIPINKPHPLLNEIQNKTTYESKYDEKHLLGHEVLRILIARAPVSNIDDSWLNVILAIAGDPRVPSTHPSYQKWWSALNPALHSKVRKWLSKLDLRLFLEALKDYSYQPGNNELKRMFASRKVFLEGLLNKELITHTRLYLSPGAASYLRRHYKQEHLPDFSMVMDGGKSIIHVELNNAQLIEGSHSCYLWIYKRLDPSAIVYDYNRRRVTYSSLTQGLSSHMLRKGIRTEANITHNPTNFSWQKKAIATLKALGVNITAQDVLSAQDYSKFKRRHGIM